MKAKDFDKKVDDGEDIKRVNVDFPQWMVDAIIFR